MHKPHGPIDTSKGYDTTDLSIPGIVKGVAFFFIFTTISVALAYLYLVGANKMSLVTQGVGSPPKVERTVLPQPPNPLLQNNVTIRVDLWKMRAEENKKLNSAGWIDKQKGVAHIPISQAIEDEAKNLEAAR